MNFTFQMQGFNILLGCERNQFQRGFFSWVFKHLYFFSCAQHANHPVEWPGNQTGYCTNHVRCRTLWTRCVQSISHHNRLYDKRFSDQRPIYCPVSSQWRLKFVKHKVDGHVVYKMQESCWERKALQACQALTDSDNSFSRRLELTL